MHMKASIRTTQPPPTCLSYSLDYYLGHIQLPDDNFKRAIRIWRNHYLLVDKFQVN